MSNEYSSLSKKLTKLLSRKEKKDDGIFFTPPDCIENNLQILKPYFKKNKIKKILEPSCGSCEYVLAINREYPNIEIDAIEYNSKIYQEIKEYQNPRIKIRNLNFLEYDTTDRYDLIIGNPPYYVMKKKDVDKNYYSYFEGRPNIFVLFIVKSFELLSSDGIISFVLPKNFMNCLYYNKVREEIINHYQILDIIDCSSDKYIETQQDTVIFIFQKHKQLNNSKFVININNKYSIIAPPSTITNLDKLYKNSTNLHSMGFKVTVGTVVWNQCKDILTDDSSKTRLIYSSDITNNQLKPKTYKNLDKKNFIEKEGLSELLLVLNRGYGKGEYNFNYCLIDTKEKYLIENHLICVRYQKKITKSKLLKLYQQIIDSLANKKTNEFINLYFGNNAINTTELSYILPIYL